MTTTDPAPCKPGIVRTAAVYVATAALLLLALAFWLHWKDAHGLEADARILPATGFSRTELPILGMGARADAFMADLGISSSLYPYIRIELAGRDPADKVYLLWQTARQPGRTFGAAVPWAGGDVVLRMSTKEQWSGTLAGVGIGAAGPTAGPIRVERLVLEPASPWNLAVSTWQEWTAFEGQQRHSMNFVVGGGPGVSPLLRPIPSLAAVLGLSLLLYLVSTRRMPGRRELAVCAAIFVVVWTIADLRWAVDLARQNRVTLDRYGGKTLSQKHLAAEDPELYRFAQELIERLPYEPQPVFVMTEDPLGASRYLRFRLAFHLFPHNVYAYRPYPPSPEDTVRPSYAVLTTPNKWINYDARTGMLRWVARYRATEPPKESNLGALPAVPLYQGSIGTLYRIE